MNHRLPVLFACLLGLPAPGIVSARVSAQDAIAAPEAAAAWAPRTGDAVVDARLADINAYAARHPEAFIDELVRYFGGTRPLLEQLLGARRKPGDLYYACALARVSGRPCRGVLEAWQAGGGAGWEAIAREVGVEPGDARAQRLREGIVRSYAHWGRPLPVGD